MPGTRVPGTIVPTSWDSLCIVLYATVQYSPPQYCMTCTVVCATPVEVLPHKIPTI
jgi:hypothetical protein